MGTADARAQGLGRYCSLFVTVSGFVGFRALGLIAVCLGTAPIYLLGTARCLSRSQGLRVLGLWDLEG